MHEQQPQNKDVFSSLMMRVLAIIGLAAILALIAWVIVYGVRSAPQTGEGIEAAVTGVSSLLRTDADSVVSFALDTYTFESGATEKIVWTYAGTSDTPQFFFSYECEPGVLFGVMLGQVWVNLACDTPLLLTDTNLTIRPTATVSRFNDITLKVVADTDVATAVVGVVNTNLAAEADSADSVSNTTTSGGASGSGTGSGTPTTPSVPVTPTTPTTVVRPTTPADLSIDILETGVLEDVLGRRSFFPLSPIPIDREGGVKFVVTNEGGMTSGSWSFVAQLPTESDPTYAYTSAIQAGLLPGATIEFTLGFDDILDSTRGTIRISLVPSTLNDASYNNVDSVVISIDR